MKSFISFVLFLTCAFAGSPSTAALPTHDVFIQWSFNYQPIPGKTLAGFRLYKDGHQVCETSDPTATSMNCLISSEDGTFNFTLTAFTDDGIESLHSAPYTFTLQSPSTAEPLQAIIQTTPTELTAEVPFTVLLDATPSTGNIASYSWSFGDGETAQGKQVEHIYLTAGIYTAVLTVQDDNGATSRQEITITAQEQSAQNSGDTPPTAIISSSASTGPCPLKVLFDGSGSQPGSTPIAAYNWSFGDGYTATGPAVNHNFTTAGIFQTVLTVTDEQGYSSHVSTPIIITRAPGNQQPEAVISATPTYGTVPLAVSFNGSASRDPDGKIVNYTWLFGDGSSATGPVVKHIYKNQANYTVTLQVTDDSGATAVASTTIQANREKKSKLKQIAIVLNGSWFIIPIRQ